MAEDKKKEYGSGYDKKPLWQWVLIYLAIGIIIYGVIYYFLLGGNRDGGNSDINVNQGPTNNNPFNY